jgi:dTMP kinase
LQLLFHKANLELMTEFGKYIVFEGGDNAGKTTQARILAVELDSVLIREPGGTHVGEQIRSLILHSDEEMTPHTQALLHAATRAQLAQDIIVPSIESGIHVVADRSWVSSAVYQGVQGVEFSEIEAINKFSLGELINPDLLLLLDADPKELVSRSSGELDRYERERLEFHVQVREKYLAVGKKLGAVIIDATASVEDVSKEIRSFVTSRLDI